MSGGLPWATFGAGVAVRAFRAIPALPREKQGKIKRGRIKFLLRLRVGETRLVADRAEGVPSQCIQRLLGGRSGPVSIATAANRTRRHGPSRQPSVCAPAVNMAKAKTTIAATWASGGCLASRASGAMREEERLSVEHGEDADKVRTRSTAPVTLAEAQSTVADETRSSHVVDTHVHVWPRGLVHAAQHGPAALNATPVDLLGTLDASGVDAAVVSPAAVHPDNSYILAAAEGSPRRLLAVVRVGPNDAMVERAIQFRATQGAVGIRMSVGPTSPCDIHLAVMDDALDIAASLGLVVQWTMPLVVSSLIERAASRTTIRSQVLDHLGLPRDVGNASELARVRDLAQIPSLFIKLSGMYALSKENYPYRDTWNWAEAVIDAFGPDRTMWGSDWPLSVESGSYGEQLALPTRLPFITREAGSAILCGTARHVWLRSSD